MGVGGLPETQKVLQFWDPIVKVFASNPETEGCQV